MERGQDSAHGRWTIRRQIGVTMRIGIIGMCLGIVTLTSSMTTAQSVDIQVTERLAYERFKLLRDTIRVGWTSDKVRAVVGEPEGTGATTEGGSIIEVWSYRGHEVLVDFRDGRVVSWFFRFMP